MPVHGETPPKGRLRSVIGPMLTSLLTSLAASTGLASTAPVEITFVTPYNPEEMGLNELIAEFARVEPGIKVNYVAGGESKWQVMAAGGAAPEIGRVNDDYVVDYALKGLALPLDSFVKRHPLPGPNEYIPYFWDWPRVGGQQVAWITAITPRLLYVNVDLFNRAGVDLPPLKWESPQWNWDSFLAAAKKLTFDSNGDGKPDIWATSIFHDTGFEQTFAVNNGGPGIYSPEGRRFALADPPGIEAIQWVADLANVWHVHPTRAEISANGGTDRMFAEGKIAMLFGDLRGRMTFFRRSIRDSFQWAMRPVPMRVRGIQEGSLDTYVIVPGSRHPEEGFKWLRFLASEAGSRIQAKLGFSIGLKREWVRRYFLQPDLMPLNQEVIGEAIPYYVPVNKAVNVEQARRIYRPVLNEVFDGKRSARDALTAVRAQVEQLLAAYPDARW